jgi:hypothetical protein
MQTPQAAALAEVFVKAAERLWDAACEEETPAMWETGREIASWVLAVCHRGLGEKAAKRTRQAVATMPAPQTPSDDMTSAPGASYLPGMRPALEDVG